MEQNTHTDDSPKSRVAPAFIERALRVDFRKKWETFRELCFHFYTCPMMLGEVQIVTELSPSFFTTFSFRKKIRDVISNITMLRTPSISLEDNQGNTDFYIA